MVAMQVTATEGGYTGNGIFLNVKVLNATAAVQNGGTGHYAASTGPAAASVTTTVTGSMVYGAFAVGTDTAATIRTGTTVTVDHDDTTHSDRYYACQSTTATGTPGATIFGTTAPTSAPVLYYAAAFAEIIPDGVITEDPSAPPLAQTESASSVTTDSFSPPGGALMIAQVACNGSDSGLTTMAVTGGGLIWTPLDEGKTCNGIYAGLWAAVAADPDPLDPLITITEGGSTNPGMIARIKVLTGAAPVAAQTGAHVTQSGAAAHQASITTTVTGSIVYGGLAAFTSVAPTAATGTTLLDNFQDSANGNYYGTCRTTAATGTPGAVTVGESAPAVAGGVALAEILPVTPGGTITEDASSPASVTTTSTITVQVIVLPPVGSLLVLMIGSDSSSGVETMTVSGGGLNWTPLSQANTAGQMYAGVWVADVPPVLAAPGLQPPEPPRYRPGRKRPGLPMGEDYAPWPPWDQAWQQPAAVEPAQLPSPVTPWMGSYY
jgi:hypothetical protein